LGGIVPALFSPAKFSRIRLLQNSFALVLLLGLAAGSLRAADAANAGDERLRAALRDATRQLTTAQADLANQQAANATLTEENRALAEKSLALQKQLDAEKAAASKTATGLGAQLNDLKGANARLTEALEKARAEAEAATQAARTADARSAKITSENIAWQRRAADREAKNLALFMVANEILTRFEEFSLGNAIAAREPFIGKSRTRLENLMQDYQDKILDQRATP
jgi:chromosome segregation ATPase